VAQLQNYPFDSIERVIAEVAKYNSFSPADIVVLPDYNVLPVLV